MIVEFCLLSSLLCLQTHAVPDFLISPDVQESNVTARQTANLQQLIQGTINIKTKFAEQEQQLSELEREKDILMTTMFDQSADYNGHHYLASRLYYEHIDMVEYLCQLFGGYLVEINDEGELNFLRPFLNSSSVWTFLVGAVRNNKNQWEYKFSGKTVTYFDWQKNMPPDTEDKCMTVSKSSNWQMNDAPCITTGDSDNFICEIPNP